MALELKQHLKLSQQLVMTPQLQQAIKLLQLSRMELVGLVQKELQENPVLEETLEGDDDRPSDTGDGGETADLAADTSQRDREAGEASVEAEARTGEGTESEREPTDAEKVADVDWQNYMDARPQTAIRESGGDDERPSIENTLTRRESLGDHLLWQLQLADFPMEEDVAAHFIIGNIDDKGYLASTLEEISRQSGVNEEVVGRALSKVQPSRFAIRSCFGSSTSSSRASSSATSGA
jgi:RNA polymerase sigma-54 factor